MSWYCFVKHRNLKINVAQHAEEHIIMRISLLHLYMIASMIAIIYNHDI